MRRRILPHTDRDEQQPYRWPVKAHFPAPFKEERRHGGHQNGEGAPDCCDGNPEGDL
jgi:hypothetical protein